MRRASLYPKLAASALRKNIRIYLPYLLASTGTVMMFNLLLGLSTDPQVASLRGGAQVQLVLALGCIVVAIFSAILLFYTNGVIVRQRKREFGLYNILGMEKRHVGLVLLWETIYTALISFALGVLGSLVFSKLAQMLILHMLGGSVNLKLGFQPGAALATLALFLGIFLLTLVKNLAVLFRARPVELLRSASEGEREPKSRWLLAALGVLTLGGGYVLSLRTNDVYNAIGNFFIAVILVIIGTYLLFTTFSIVLLKALRKNKRYYYKTNHFVAVSGMLYRMKRNAMGLASICILSTMVLVTVSTTFSLYLGIDGVMDARYPSEVGYSMRWEETTDVQRAEALECVRALVEDYDLQIEDDRRYAMLSFVSLLMEDGATLDFDRRTGVPSERFISLNVLMMEDYAGLGGAAMDLKPGEALVYSSRGRKMEEMHIGEISLRLHAQECFPERVSMNIYADEVENVYLVVDGVQTLLQIAEVEQSAYGKNASAIRECVSFNLKGSEADVLAYETALVDVAVRGDYDWTLYSLRCRQKEYYEEYLAFYGAMFFLGMFLGFLFVMTTVTIMYYKQVSEGMEDRGRYAIMQKVGMTRAEVRSSIRSQVLTVFFLPLGTAAVHVACAFPMIVYILAAFGVQDVKLFALCTLGCFGVFTVLYVAVYLLTARAYNRIVEGRQG